MWLVIGLFGGNLLFKPLLSPLTGMIISSFIECRDIAFVESLRQGRDLEIILGASKASIDRIKANLDKSIHSFRLSETTMTGHPTLRTIGKFLRYLLRDFPREYERIGDFDQYRLEAKVISSQYQLPVYKCPDFSE